MGRRLLACVLLASAGICTLRCSFRSKQWILDAWQLVYLFNLPSYFSLFLSVSLSLAPLGLTQILQGFKIGPKLRSEQSGRFVLIAEGAKEKEGDTPDALWQGDAGTRHAWACATVLRSSQTSLPTSKIFKLKVLPFTQPWDQEAAAHLLCFIHQRRR